MPSPVKMDKLLKDQNISFESWTYNEEIAKKINAFEFKCYRRLMGISWRDRRTNESVKEQVEDLAGVQKPQIQIAQERKMKFFGHVTKHPSELRLANTIMNGRVPGKRGRGRPRRCWITDSCDWTRSTPSKLVYRAPRYCHITPLLTELHWLNNEQRIDFKVILITNKAIPCEAPGYISYLISLKPNFKICTEIQGQTTAATNGC